jgi:hypothetical protein
MAMVHVTTFGKSPSLVHCVPLVLQVFSAHSIDEVASHEDGSGTM